MGEDLDVLLELCDRILVLCGGKVSGIVDARTATKEEVGLMMTRVGGGKEAASRCMNEKTTPDPPGQAGHHGPLARSWCIRGGSIVAGAPARRR